MAVRDPANTREWELMLAYRRVFNTADGRLVLEDILSDLHFLDTIGSLQDAALHNAAKMLLFKCGILQDHQLPALYEGLFKLPYSPPKGDKEIPE